MRQGTEDSHPIRNDSCLPAEDIPMQNDEAPQPQEYKDIEDQYSYIPYVRGAFKYVQ